MRLFVEKSPKLEDMMVWVRETLVSFGLEPHQSKKFEIAVEEALVNVIQHAYGDKEVGPIEIRFKIDPAKGEVQVVLIDEGIPFNPLTESKAPNLKGSLSEREVGGLGIHFMKNMADQVDYKREGKQNVLTLSKHFKTR